MPVVGKPRGWRGWLLLALPLLAVVICLLVLSWGGRSSARAGPAVGIPQTPIRHVIFILKENRSFDEYFGRFPGVDGATSGTMSDGQTVSLGPTPDPLPNDIGHSHASWVVAYDGGRMDGFDRERGAFSKAGENLAYTQMRQDEIPNYWAYASRYGLGDAMFADWKGASFGNNLFEFAAQAGQFDPGTGYRSAVDIPHSPTHLTLVSWGCDDPLDTHIAELGGDDSQTQAFPCYSFRALPNTLAKYGVSWRFYVGAYRHNALDALRPVRFVPSLWAHVLPQAQLAADLAAGRLPAVAWIYGAKTEHPPLTACDGENETVGVVNAVMQSPYWSSTAIVITYDEWGGFYDHVPPPQVDNVSYGFRVPLIVISPFVKTGGSPDGGYVSHTFFSHESLLKFVEANWSLPSLTPRDAGANDMMDFFDFAGPPKGPLVLSPRSCPKRASFADAD